jgi:glycosidase
VVLQRPRRHAEVRENPPKKYQDIYNVNWDTEDWQGLWQALLEVVQLWVRRGVRVFRVDNPHTKPFAFWEWLIAEVRAEEPDVVFLAEAFTKAAVMRALAKLGFSQSYTYFTWKTSATTSPSTSSSSRRRACRTTTAELLRQHARHPRGVPAARRPPAFHARLVLAPP